MNTNMTGFRWSSKIFALDESSLSIGRVDGAQLIDDFESQSSTVVSLSLTTSE